MRRSFFAPAAGGDTTDEARHLSLNAMTNLMCRGRKRGLAGVIATQRLAKLAKNVAAEASNFLMGRTFLDIDMVRAADLLGMEKRLAEGFRDLARGQFMALGPALSRRPLKVMIGAVETRSMAAGPELLPFEAMRGEDLRDIILEPVASFSTPPPRESRPPPPGPPQTIGSLYGGAAETLGGCAPSGDGPHGGGQSGGYLEDGQGRPSGA